MEILDIIMGALSGYQVVVILLLVFLDLGLGVAKAWRQKNFDAEKLADFYGSQVLPDILGYTVLYVAVTAATNQPDIVDFLGAYKNLVSEAALAIGLAALVGKLGKSALESFKGLYGTTP